MNIHPLSACKTVHAISMLMHTTISIRLRINLSNYNELKKRGVYVLNNGKR